MILPMSVLAPQNMIKWFLHLSEVLLGVPVVKKTKEKRLSGSSVNGYDKAE